MSETGREQYAWQRFHPEQIIAQDGNSITIVQSPFYGPERWTAARYDENGWIWAYRRVGKPEQGA